MTNLAAFGFLGVMQVSASPRQEGFEVMPVAVLFLLECVVAYIAHARRCRRCKQAHGAALAALAEGAD